MGAWRWAAAAVVAVGVAAPSLTSTGATGSTSPAGWQVKVDAPGGPVAVPAATAVAGAPSGSVQQRIAIPVLPGRLSVSPTSASVVLHRVASNRYVGSWGPLQVVDARGSLVGWTAAIGLGFGTASGRLVVTPNPPVAVTGRPDEVVAAQAAVLTPGRSTLVMSGAAGGGGGTFSVTGTLTLTGGPANGPDTLTVPVVFSVA
jgi:hypothetical protein